jgi:hypothetical protein
MSTDPRHVIDAIDGVVDDWEASSADSMRWAPPEKHEPDLFDEATQLLAPLAHAVTELLRPVGEAIDNAVDRLIEGPEDRR